jgi:hypothetical protein
MWPELQDSSFTCFSALNVAACLWLQYLTFLQNTHIKQPIRVKRREARIFFIPLR